MRKLLNAIMVILLSFMTVTPLKASETDPYISDLISDSNAIASLLEEKLGINSTELFELMALPEKDVSFYGNSIKRDKLDTKVEKYVDKYNSLGLEPFKPSDYDLSKPSVSVRAAYDVNPPLSDAEQNERMEYIADIFEREYYQDRYQDKVGKYYLYLYTSHWTENSNFERDGDNYFDKIYANIICQNDIDAFDTFYSKIRDGAIADTFAIAGGVVQSIKESGIDKTTIKEALKLTKDYVIEDSDAFTKALTDQGIDITSIHDITDQMYKIYMSNYNSVNGAEAMIDLINSEMNQYGVSGYATQIFVHFLGSLKTDVILATMGMPMLGIGLFYFQVLSDIYPMVTLASLYYSYNIRRADRLSIYYGLFDRP